MFDILVLVGSHASGKTTLGRLASNVLGWPFYEEIGKKLRLEVLASDPSAFATGNQPDFDRRVTELEIQRDQSAMWPCLVETWHPGNLAYVQARSHALFEPLRQTIETSLAERSPHVLIQPLSISKATMLSRFDEPGEDRQELVDFLHPIGKSAIAIAQAMGFTQAPTIETDHLSPEAVLRAFLSNLQALQDRF